MNPDWYDSEWFQEWLYIARNPDKTGKLYFTAALTVGTINNKDIMIPIFHVRSSRVVADK